MSFGRWVPLAQAAQHAPACPGVFQLRVAHGVLLEYPRGKSAMIYYGAADDLHLAISELSRSYPDRSWLCRHMATENPQRAVTSLLDGFQHRFGTTPHLPNGAPRDADEAR